MNTKKVFLDFVQRNICRKGKRLQVRYGNCISYTVKNSVHEKGKVKTRNTTYLSKWRHSNWQEEDTGVTVTLEPLVHQAIQQGAAVVTEGGAGVGVREELVPRSLNLESLFFNSSCLNTKTQTSVPGPASTPGQTKVTNSWHLLWTTNLIMRRWE